MKSTIIFTLFALLLPLLVSCTEKQSYIVYFGEQSGYRTNSEIEDYHHSYLSSLKGSEEEARDSLLYSYKNSIDGFAAKLTPDEALKLSELDEVISVFPSKKVTPHTTRSWEFLGVRKGEKRNVPSPNELLLKAKYGKSVVVGLLDTGIWPESKSFNDKGMGPIPKSWKGSCQEGEAFNSSHCNKKIIGAKYYFKGYEFSNGPINSSDYRSARDHEGHGTHTSSTVGGRLVHAKMPGGFAHGTASGGAPLVHLAMYKVCWPECSHDDMLAAIDDAIGDGVDVLSISLGGISFGYSGDALAIGSLHAVKNNIIVACSGGNDGPTISTVGNTAPWIMTVAASSIDRALTASVLLGNGKKIMGVSATQYKLEDKMYPLVYAGTIGEPHVNQADSSFCMDGSLSPNKAKGKIVLCMRGTSTRLSKGEEVKRAGGAGMILANSDLEGEGISADAHVLPAAAVGWINAQKILNYIGNYSHEEPIAYINPGRTVLNFKPAPYMASFSSRGPSIISPDILKPDITAPGLDILAAWTEAEPSPMKYNIISGTSMSCPHVAGVAALLKAIHPTWSSAAIRSAIMTTAVQSNNMKKPITDSAGNEADPFQYGSGHINPTKAADPGLVYDASYTDYLLFLCSTTSESLDKSFKCPKNPPSGNNFNYPSLAISQLNGTVTVKRTVTNVGNSSSSYILQSEAPPGVYVKFSHSRLKFNHYGEKKSFTITVDTIKKGTRKNEGYVFGWYSWSDGTHVVRSPIAVNLS